MLLLLQTILFQLQKNCLEDATNKEAFSVKTVRWMAQKYLPFNFFDDLETQKYFQFINPNVTVPQRNALRALVMKTYEDVKQSVIQDLRDNTSKISFTVDGWTSINRKSYYGVTAHFIDKKWQFKSVILDFIPSNGKHTGRDIAQMFYTLLKSHGGLEKVQGITMDNASSNTTFMQQFSKIMEENMLDFDAENQHFHCFAHILNLAVQDALKHLYADCKDENTDDEEMDKDNAMIKLRSIFLKLKRSEQLQIQLKSCCDVTNTTYFSPIVDVSTRWNSTYKMLKMGLKIRLALNALCLNNLKLNRFIINDNEWYVIKVTCHFLKDFKMVSTLLGGDKYITLPFVIVAFNLLLDKIENAMSELDSKEDQNEVDINMLSAYRVGRDKLLKYYQITNWMYCVSLILDPRHKSKTFEKTSWGKELVVESLNKFKTIFRKNYYEKNASHLNKNKEVTSRKDDSDDSDNFLDIKSIFDDVTSAEEKWENEINDYVNTKRAHKDEDILQWSKQEDIFPNLSLMAKDFLSITATSVPAERLFSKAGLIIRKHRNRLNNKSARALLCLNS